jgi:hypothetical protein
MLPVKKKIKNPSVTNRQTCTSSKKYSVDFQRLTQIRKNIFQPPPPLLTPQKPQFLSQPPLFQQFTAKRFFASRFPYIWRDKFFSPTIENRKSKLKNNWFPE